MMTEREKEIWMEGEREGDMDGGRERLRQKNT